LDRALADSGPGACGLNVQLLLPIYAFVLQSQQNKTPSRGELDGVSLVACLNEEEKTNVN
jgi:hypothetical protein